MANGISPVMCAAQNLRELTMHGDICNHQPISIKLLLSKGETPPPLITTHLVTRLLGLMSSNPGAGSQNLPTLSSFPESLQPAYQDIPDDWFNLDDMEMELSGSRDIQEMRVLNDYMLHVYENGPDQINSNDELDDERSVPSESPSEDGRSEFEESRGTPPEPSLGFT
ncbi:hypothetical protein F5876DRAFT_78430 [Lentinula aff. lateritia]|uniref:Uncharacterized protein n=1 Tax=Lentinula aff. lateritia TaxID=2804960 RepID=A0ACC1TVD5_9AGAR|nr:hypothetical protein F5876DRAFT_78430 [Lentinula aff. lateritia]